MNRRNNDHTFGTKNHITWPTSLWRENTPIVSFSPLAGSERRDIVVIGAGFTGLWTALELLALDPRRSVTVLDAAQPGFGASGRNGGWCSAMSPMSLDSLARDASPASARSFQQAMNDTVTSIGAFVEERNISCDWEHAGTITLARNAPQMTRLKADIDQARRHGWGEDFLRLCEPDEIARRLSVPGVLGATYSPHCATVDPLALCNGLTQAACDAGATIHGHSRLVRHMWNGRTHRLDVAVPNDLVTIECDWLVFATEGFTARLKGHRRDIAPLYSYMVSTAPLDAAAWDEIGWTGRETVTDARRLVIYAQRTADDRIAFGGRGAPYRFASRIGPVHDSHATVHERIIDTMHEMFPAARDTAVTHRWGGALGVTRDWHAMATVNSTDRTGFAGGYVGDGVALSRLAASGLARAILGIDDEIARLPIVGHRGPRWEPEPLRWLGINAMLRVVALADRIEERRNRPSRLLDTAIDSLLG